MHVVRDCFRRALQFHIGYRAYKNDHHWDSVMFLQS